MSKTIFASPYVKNGAEFFAAHIGCQLSALSSQLLNVYSNYKIHKIPP